MCHTGPVRWISTRLSKRPNVPSTWSWITSSLKLWTSSDHGNPAFTCLVASCGTANVLSVTVADLLLIFMTSFTVTFFVFFYELSVVNYSVFITSLHFVFALCLGGLETMGGGHLPYVVSETRASPCNRNCRLHTCLRVRLMSVRARLCTDYITNVIS